MRMLGFGKVPWTVQVRFTMILLSWWSPSPPGNLDTENLLSTGGPETKEGWLSQCDSGTMILSTCTPSNKTFNWTIGI